LIDKTLLGQSLSLGQSLLLGQSPLLLQLLLPKRLCLPLLPAKLSLLQLSLLLLLSPHRPFLLPLLLNLLLLLSPCSLFLLLLLLLLLLGLLPLLFPFGLLLLAPGILVLSDDLKTCAKDQSRTDNRCHCCALKQTVFHEPSCSQSELD
jgi:hypothetical protein